MRDSGQNWLGSIPSTWGLSRIGSLYSLRNEKVSDKDYPPLSVTMKGVVPQLESAAKSDDGDNRKLVKIGDFAINSRSDRRGSCGISAYNGSVSLINTVLTPRGEMNPGYYNWLFHTVSFADEFYKWGHGIVDDLWTTRWQEMKRIVVPVPSSDEQQAIAAYLDDQVAQIESIIAEAQASIEEYKQWREAIIYETVCKGIFAHASFRDTGDMWLKSLPLGIKLSRVGLHFELILGKMLCPNQLDANYSLEPYYCAANVHFNGVDETELKQMWFSPDEKTKYLVQRGDLLVVEGGAGAGGCSIAYPSQDTYIQNSIMIVRPRRDMDVRYVKYLLEMLVKRGYVDFVCNKATIPHFTKEKLANTPLPVFPENEVKAMCDHIDKQYKKIDSIIAEKEALISDLGSYKQSLIYEVVTGKRKVV